MARRSGAGAAQALSLSCRGDWQLQKEDQIHSLFSKIPAINWLSFARIFLFASRDVWFVVGLPVFLSGLRLSFTQIGGFLALWVIGYGIVQAAVPNLLRLFGNREVVNGAVARNWAFALLFCHSRSWRRSSFICRHLRA